MEALELSEWFPQADGLLPGQRKRGDHTCGDPGTLLLSRDSDGRYSAYCFRCGRRGSFREQESLEQKLNRIKQEASADIEAQRSMQLPEPRVRDTREWPVADKLWFYKMGLSPSRIEKLGLYWCPKIGRVVLPIVKDGEVVYWTARAQGRTPKWIGPNADKRGLTARYGVGKGDTIVLTEDPLSAFKVGLVTEAWSLLGTKLHPTVLLELSRSGKRVAVWLDDDRGRKGGRNPGQEAAAQIMRLLLSVGVDARNITSPRDPKYFPTDYIKEKLQ